MQALVVFFTCYFSTLLFFININCSWCNMYIHFHPIVRLSARVCCWATFFLTVFRDESSKNHTNTSPFVDIVFSTIIYRSDSFAQLRGTIIIQLWEKSEILLSLYLVLSLPTAFRMWSDVCVCTEKWFFFRRAEWELRALFQHMAASSLPGGHSK